MLFLPFHYNASLRLPVASTSRGAMTLIMLVTCDALFNEMKPKSILLKKTGPNKEVSFHSQLQHYTHAHPNNDNSYHLH